MRLHLALAAAGIGLLALGYSIGRFARPHPVRTVTEVQTKEVVRWEKSEAARSVATVTAEKTATVRVVTRWLRKDGTTAKVQTRGASTTTESTEISASTVQREAHGQTDRSSESRTDVSPVLVSLRPRFHVQGFVGIDLGAGLRRQYAGAVSYRVAGPVWVSVVTVPQMGFVGAGVGLSF